MVTLIAGPMKSGKSTEMFRQMERKHIAGKRVLLFCPNQDSRPFYARNVPKEKLYEVVDELDTSITDWEKVKDEEIQNIVDQFDAIFIDEFFMIKNNERICKFLPKDLNHKCDLFFGGLIADANAKAWDETVKILPYCDNIIKLDAVCEVCGNEHANFSYTKGIKPGELVIGDGIYQALCRKCYLKKMGE